MAELDKTQMTPGGDRTVISPVGDTTVVGGPPTGAGVQFDCVVGRGVESAARPDRALVLLALTGHGTAGVRMSTNLCLLIDRSGSMEGQPLEYAKQACGYVVDSLEQSDVLSIVAFDDQVEVVMPPRRVVNKELIKQHLGKVYARGTTNVYDGLSAAMAQATSLGTGGYVSRIIFLTDGAPTSGIKEHGQIVQLARNARDAGVSVSTLGFGVEYNEELLSGISRAGGGSHFYIARPEMIPEVFRLEIGSVMRVVAKNVNVELLLAKWVHCVQVLGKEATIGDRFARFGLMDVEAGGTLTALAELSLLPRRPGTYRIGRALLRYDDCVTQTRSEVEQPVVLRFTGDDAEVPRELDPRVAREWEVNQAARQLQQTMVGLKTMQLSATQALDQLAATRSLLAQQGRDLEATQVDLAIAGLRQGGVDPQKSLTAALHQLDSGKRGGGGTG